MALIELWVEGLTAEMETKAKEELGETEEVKAEAIDKLKQLIEKENNFKPIMEDIFLLRFLRMKKYDVKQAFKTLQNYYLFKSKYSGYVTDLTPRDLQKILDINKFIISPFRDSSGAIVFYTAYGAFDLDVGTVEEFSAAMLLSLDLTLDLEATQVCGVTIIVDFAGISPRLFFQYFRPSYMIMGTQSIMNTIPVRIKAIYAINEPSYCKFFYNTLVRPLLSEKLKKRLTFHGSDLTELKKEIPLECLAESIGGKLKESDFESFKKEFCAKQSRSETLQNYTYKGKIFSSQKYEENAQ